MGGRDYRKGDGLTTSGPAEFVVVGIARGVDGASIQGTKPVRVVLRHHDDAPPRVAYSSPVALMFEHPVKPASVHRVILDVAEVPVTRHR